MKTASLHMLDAQGRPAFLAQLGARCRFLNASIPGFHFWYAECEIDTAKLGVTFDTRIYLRMSKFSPTFYIRPVLAFFCWVVRGHWKCAEVRLFSWSARGKRVMGGKVGHCQPLCPGCYSVYIGAHNKNARLGAIRLPYLIVFVYSTRLYSKRGLIAKERKACF